MPNFSFLACLEVGEKFGVVWGVGQVATVSYLNPSYAGLVGVELSKVELGLGFDNNRVACFILVISLKAIAANYIMTSSIGCCIKLLLGRKDHCTTAAFIVLGLVTYLGVIGCTSKQVLNPSTNIFQPSLKLMLNLSRFQPRNMLR